MEKDRMPPPDVLPPLRRFGDFEVDLRAGELRKQGRRMRLQEQPLRVLSMLLERPGELVTREQLRLQLWPADTFVDFDHGLNSAVARLRESLNDSAEEPRFIETVPRRGYRFVGELKTSELNRAEPEPPPKVAETAAPPSWWMSRRTWVALAAVLLLLGLVAIRTRAFSKKRSDTPLPAPEVIPLAGLAGYEVGPAFSPDGNQVAFTEINGQQNSGIYTTLVGGEQSLRLTRDPRDCCAAWSPDSREIAFLRRRDNQLDIYVVPALGGSERRLYSMASVQYPWLNWSPDGKLLVFPRTVSGNSNSAITIFSLADASTRQLTSPPDAYLDRDPAFSPDGQSLAFVRGTMAGVANDVYVMALNGGELRRLTFDNRPISGIAWTPDSKDLIYSGGRGGTEALWRVPFSGGTPRPVTLAGNKALVPSISRRGNELAYQQAIGKDNMWRIHVKNGRLLPEPATIAIAAKGRKMRPSFSPDGKKIAFESDRLGAMEIWSCDIHGISCAELTSLHGIAGTPRWSPDGQSIAFEFHPGELAEVYVVDVNGALPRQITSIPGADNLAPSWSRDGRWLYFSSKRGREPFQLWKVPVAGGAPVQVSRTGGISAVESADGKYLYFSKYEQNGIWRMPLQGGAEIRILDKPGGPEWFNWGLAHDGIYFLNSSKEPKATVEFFDFATGKTRSLYALDKPWDWGLAVEPDEKSVLFVEAEFEESNIVVVKNFR
jgi:Tol biopolymer transport system component/DNA-binding winged helix-turn-helix (wHTH) protein